MLKKQTKRSQVKYPALNQEVNLKTRSDLLDYDYLNKLPETWVDPKTGKSHNPKQWLNDFTEEYVSTSFNKKKRVHKKIGVASPQNKSLNDIKTEFLTMIKNINELINNSSISVKSKNNLRKNISKFKKSFNVAVKKSLSKIDDHYKKDSETRNNARNRCIMTRARAQGKMLSTDMLPAESYGVNLSAEDHMIERIDGLNNIKSNEN